MVFSSMHPYLDPVGNWQQQEASHGDHHHQIGSSSRNTTSGGPGCEGEGHGWASIRPSGSMAEKCPRCESTNTKFCYFNNYSLSQPRHFCKTCRRYWTRGGALRSVPVGGGSRKNKRRTTKPTTSNSLYMSSSSSSSSSSSAADIIIGQLPSLSFTTTTTPPTTLPHLGSSENYGFTNYTSVSSAAADLGFHIGTAFTPAHQTQQFPFFATGFEAPPPLYRFDGTTTGPMGGHQLPPKEPAGVVTTQLASMKMEDHHQELRQLLGFNNNNNSSNHHEHYWNTSARNSSPANWTHLSGFISSSTPGHQQ